MSGGALKSSNSRLGGFAIIIVFFGVCCHIGLSVSVSYKVDLVLLVFAGNDVFCVANYCAKVVGFPSEGDTQGLKEDKGWVGGGASSSDKVAPNELRLASSFAQKKLEKLFTSCVGGG